VETVFALGVVAEGTCAVGIGTVDVGLVGEDIFCVRVLWSQVL